MVGDIDSAWRNAVDRADTNLVVDLRDCSFLEPASMVFLLGQFSYVSKQAAWSIRVRLPENARVRDSLRAWQFPQAVRAVTGVPFIELVVPEDRRYFGESSSTKRSTLIHHHSFATQTLFRSDRTFDYTLAAEHSASWQSRYVLSVLKRYFSDRGERVASHIIHEAIMNAIVHPGASTVITNAFLQEPVGKTDADASPGKLEGHLTIAIWDDGESMVDTLTHTLAEGGNPQSVVAERLYRDYAVRLSKTEVETVQTIRSDLVPNSETPEEVVLLSTTFPGISRDATRATSLAMPQVVAEDVIFRHPGMGLYVLLNTCLDVFRGSVAIRTKNYFVNLRLGEGKDSASGLPPYMAKVVRFEDTGWFPGNLITVRLPLF